MERLWNIGDSRPVVLAKFTSDYVITMQENDPSKTKQQYRISTVVWNSSGSMLAVAYRANQQVFQLIKLIAPVVN